MTSAGPRPSEAHSRCDDVVVGLVTRDLSITSSRRPGELERTYQETFGRFAKMIAQGSFPRPVRLGGARAVGWVEAHVNAWIALQIDTTAKRFGSNVRYEERGTSDSAVCGTTPRCRSSTPFGFPVEPDV